MSLSEPPREGTTIGAQPLRAVFGFDLDEQRWLERVRHSSEARAAGPGRLGEYELLEAVGRGGQGVVYRARQPRTGREIVIKRLSAGVFATPEMLARFAREVEAAAALDHPNIVTVYGSEVIEDQPVLVMQWIDGLPFDHWAATGAGGARRDVRDVRDVLGVFMRVCEAVHHAHQRGVIHRDLKPSNILVDRLDVPHVLDFGLAKVQSESLDPSLTQSGVFVGTPAYAAPEQALGQHREIDVRTDVYALGALLYQALCGVMAFEPSQELPRLLHAIQHKEPRAPSTVNARIGREVDAIVLKAMAKDKEQRYASSEALRADVESYLAGRAVLAHQPSATYRLRKFARRHKVGVAVSLTFLFLVLAATTVSTVLYLNAETARQRMTAALAKESERLTQVLQEQERSEKSYQRAHGAELLMTSLFEKALRGAQDGVGVLTIGEVLDMLSADMPSVDAKPEALGWMHMTLGNAYANLGLPARAGISRKHSCCAVRCSAR